MRYITTFLLLIIITSCNSNQKTESNSIFGKDIDGMFGILSTKTDQSIVFLMDDIHAKILRNDYDSLSLIKIQKYDKLTKDYLKYLNGIEKQYAENNVNPFFTNGRYSDKGTEYIKKTELYEKELLKLANNNQTKNRIRAKAGAYSVIAINGYEAKHLDYYFDDLPHKGIVTYLKFRQQSILELEKDFLNEILIKPEQNPTANNVYN
ncbi:hypothetical protein [Psychroserpens mesophilus]|uniref:hypothetical protein n=1 Tax=Psychroserpens mesophilus TaxID=325473 RepID=UPI0013629CE6|nr:hypothetical protein [Psychroserpens mesophilus]